LTTADEDVVRALYAEHGDALFAHALRLAGGDRQRAEDLVQETLFRAWRHPDVLDPERGSVRAWLFTTARNLSVDAWRRRSNRVPGLVTDSLPEPPSVDEAERVVEGWLIAEAVDRLTPTRRQVLIECFDQGHSEDEAAVGSVSRRPPSSHVRIMRCARCGWRSPRWGRRVAPPDLLRHRRGSA
jgi:RNA polymerase sigma-70 factor, ECF subfamily